MVPVVDLSRRTARHRASFLAVADAVLASGQLLLGPQTAALEAELAAWSGYQHGVTTSSGASALQLALSAVGVGPGDEVIVPAFTAVPTASAVCALGAIPMLADVDPCTGLLDVVAAEAARTDRTAAVVPVHLYGRPAPLPSIGVPVVEDAAQAHGALRHHGRSAAVVYSFYPTKNLGGIGDGGAVMTDDADVAQRVHRARVHGMTDQYVHPTISQNFRMSELEAAWLRLVLPSLAADNARRAEVAATYRRAAPWLQWPDAHPDHVYHLCVVRVTDREAVRNRLGQLGVSTGVHYPLAIGAQPGYRRFARGPYPHAEAWAAECISLPCFPEITDAEVDQVADALQRAMPR